MLKYLAIALVGLAPTAALADPMSWGGFYAEVYGGPALQSALSFENPPDGPYPTEIGSAFGAAVGIDTTITGLSFDFDVLATRATNSGVPVTFDSLSAMVTAKYGVPLGDKFSLYGGVGVGAIHINDEFEGGSTFSTAAAGYQILVGSAYQISPNVAITGEYRYQNAFQPWAGTGADGGMSPPPGATIDYHTSTILFGLKFSH